MHPLLLDFRLRRVPCESIDLGDPSKVIGGILSEYRIDNPPNPHPLFGSVILSIVHDELGILEITGIGKTNENDKYGQAVRECL